MCKNPHVRHLYFAKHTVFGSFEKYDIHEIRICTEGLIVEPQLSYCCSVWGCCSESKINVLQKIQNRAARIVTNSPYDASAAPLIQNLG